MELMKGSVNYLDVDRTYSQKGENHTISLGLTPPTSNQTGPKIANTDIGKWGLTWSDLSCGRFAIFSSPTGACCFLQLKQSLRVLFTADLPFTIQNLSLIMESTCSMPVSGSVMVDADNQTNNVV